ncbi:MAG: hypothetical protein COB53_02715 [Elusimicrobia bacterium]|nr:MAG: hypothetical protein COB53_02715 [Elusimicrobiota bacterium]
MKRIGFMLLVCTLAYPAIATADEHATSEHATSEHATSEHATSEHATQEHAEHPKKHSKKRKKHKKKHKWVKNSKTMKAFVAAVESYVAEKEENDGSFQVYDNKLKKTWNLSLVRIHKKRIARLGEDKFFACADFETVGKGRRKTLDLDFFVTRVDGEFVVDEIPVHKVNGKRRYTYNSKNERVPVKAKAKKKKKKKRKKKIRRKKSHSSHSGSEHPEHPM